MDTIQILKLYGLTALVFFAIDLVWLGVVAAGFYEKHREKTDLLERLREHTVENLVASQREVLKKFNVEFDSWFRHHFPTPFNARRSTSRNDAVE